MGVEKRNDGWWIPQNDVKRGAQVLYCDEEETFKWFRAGMELNTVYRKLNARLKKKTFRPEEYEDYRQWSAEFKGIMKQAHRHIAAGHRLVDKVEDRIKGGKKQEKKPEAKKAPEQKITEKKEEKQEAIKPPALAEKPAAPPAAPAGKKLGKKETAPAAPKKEAVKPPVKAPASAPEEIKKDEKLAKVWFACKCGQRYWEIRPEGGDSKAYTPRLAKCIRCDSKNIVVQEINTEPVNGEVGDNDKLDTYFENNENKAFEKISGRFPAYLSPKNAAALGVL